MVSRQQQAQVRASSQRKRPVVLKRDGYRCCRCGFGDRDKQSALTVDHMVPVSKGGSSKLPNLQTLCLNCNALKADADPSPGEMAVQAARRPRYTAPRSR